MNNQILDEGIKQVEFSKAQQKLKNNILYSLLFLIVFGVGCFVYPIDSFSKTGVLIGGVISILWSLKHDYKTFYYDLDSNTLSLFVLNALGDEIEVSYELHQINRITFRKRLFVKTYVSNIITSTSHKTFFIKGDLVIKELIPLLKQLKEDRML